jgi:hypothetical protein
MAWIKTIESNRRDERGRPAKRYRVEWYEIARDTNGQAIPRYANRPDGPPKLARRQETFDTRDAAADRVDEINPKIARGYSPAAQRDAGNRPLSHYADAWLDGLASQVKPRVLADYSQLPALYGRAVGTQGSRCDHRSRSASLAGTAHGPAAPASSKPAEGHDRC